jgi:hypothetical protein
MTTHHQLPMMGADMYITISPKFQQTIIQNLCPEILLHFQKQLEDSVMLLAQETKLIKTVHNILIQAKMSL